MSGFQTGERDVTALPMSRVVLISLVVIFMIERVIFTVLAPPIGDEAYYWMWGQNVGLSYFDHPPLHAWLLHVANVVFGWNYFGLRGLTWLTFAGSIWIFWKYSCRLSSADPQLWFWPTVALYLSSPMFMMMTVITFHDHLLIFFCLLSGYWLLVFSEHYVQKGEGFPWLYLAAIALGLGILTKYNAALVGIGGGLFLIFNRDLRSALKTPHPWLATFLVLAMQAPVLIWNYQQGFASYKFHYEDRWQSNPGFHYFGIPNFILTAVLVISPFLFPAIIKMVREKPQHRFAQHARSLALLALLSSSVFMAYISTFGSTNFYWNITAFTLLMPLVIGWWHDRRLMIAHYSLGLVLTTALLVNNIVMPLQNMVGRNDWTISSGFGWPAVASRIVVLKQTHSVGFVATTFYSTAAQLGFVMHDPNITSLSVRRDQYDYWFDASAHQGQNALIVSDPKHPIEALAPYFDRLELLDELPYEIFGKVIFSPKIYLGTNFRGIAP